jgi:hypothetical protein
MKIITRLLLIVVGLLLVSCGGSYKEFDSQLSEKFEGKAVTSNEGNDVIVVFEEMKALKHISQREEDYFISRVATQTIDYLGRTNFLGFNMLRVDVAPMQRSYEYPTKVTVKALEKLPIIADVQRLMNKEENEGLIKKFDDIIPPQMFEEQILKEWNDLKQWLGKDVTPAYIGFKLLQLPAEEGYYIQIGGKVKNGKGEQALVEFMFVDASKKVMSITITYL